MRVSQSSSCLWQLYAVLLLSFVAAGAIGVVLTRRDVTFPQQPINFQHQIMVQAGIPCLFCHTDAIRSPAAGMPSVEKCMGCHSVIGTDMPEVKKVADFWQKQEAIPWVRIYRLPRFVYFSHRVHVVAAGRNCERCHGDVGQMEVTRPAVTMDMGFCLDCHEQQSNAEELKDCLVCHQ